MTFADLAAGSSVFLDANTLIYHFTADPQFGIPCTDLLRRIERGELSAYISTHVLSDVAHRLMTIEAILLLGRPVNGIAQRLRNHRSEIANLKRFRQAIEEVPKMGIQALSTTSSLVIDAATVSQQFKLLSGDALIAATMFANGIANLASRDTDFDSVPPIVRFSPI